MSSSQKEGEHTTESSPESVETETTRQSRRRKLFGDCALVEIIHLHDCLRGALKALENDVEILSQTFFEGGRKSEVFVLERRVAGRVKVIWSVFRAHSSAEDEFIWPTLQSKTQGMVKGSPKTSKSKPELSPTSFSLTATATASTTSATATALPLQTTTATPPSIARSDSEDQDINIEQEEYEEDHADEERMFSRMDNLLTKLRSSLVQQQQQQQQQEDDSSVDDTMHAIHSLSKTLSTHLMAHLEKEEIQCLPLVVKHLSKSEIHDLVGKIMGKRSSDMIAQIMTMAVQNLNEADREEMVKYMKQAMAGTFFDRWLSMSGWMNKENSPTGDTTSTTTATTTLNISHLQDKQDDSSSSSKRKSPAMSSSSTVHQQATESQLKKSKTDDTTTDPLSSMTGADVTTGVGGTTTTSSDSLITEAHQTFHRAGEITSQAELEKLIRAIAANPNLSSLQKNTTIQGLRDSVWKSNQRLRRASENQLASDNNNDNNNNGDANNNNNNSDSMRAAQGHNSNTSSIASAAVSATCTPARRVTPPSMYFKKNADGKLEIVYNSDGPVSRPDDDNDAKVPLFSATELAPTYHDGATGAVLGCPHYARACKLRHPQSGRMYTCRLCCEQDREMPMKDQDEPLDRYAVREVMCMKCNSLQPAEDRCFNPTCESHGKAFAKYFCRICHLYDDRSRPIFHCPYCNTCRMGLGLGIDFRHCMRCNACVSLADDSHRCIPQKLQGSCPICHESLFQSTEPLRGLKCGHVMHLSCFTEYRRGQSYTCPLCMKSMEDMKDYFALLDAAVRMQPMPNAYLNTISNLYCQDCEKTGQCRYHFVGQKCPHCGSYNTREMGRVQATEALSLSAT